MGIENVIQINVPLSTSLQYFSNGAGNNTNNTQKGQFYGRVVSVPDSNRIISFQPIDGVNGSTIGQTAYPLNPYNIQLPNVNEIVPIISGPDNTSVNGGQYNRVYYYGNPVGLWSNNSNNQLPIPKPVTAKNNVTLSNIKQSEVGVVS